MPYLTGAITGAVIHLIPALHDRIHSGPESPYQTHLVDLVLLGAGGGVLGAALSEYLYPAGGNVAAFLFAFAGVVLYDYFLFEL